MLKIYLARHGQDTDNVAGILNGHRDTELTELGLSQARVLAAFIKEQNLSFAKVYSSPLKRAYVTATKVTEALGLSAPEALLLLIERDFGVMTGRNKDEVIKMCSPDILKTETITYFLEAEGSENFPQTIIRAKELLKFISDKYSDGNVLLVSHGDFGKMIYAAYYNLPWKDVLTMFHFGNTELLLLAPDTTPEMTRVFKTLQLNS